MQRISTQGTKYQNRFKHYSPKNSFLYKSSHQYKGQPQAGNNKTGDRWSSLKGQKQIDTYSKSLPKLKTLFQLEMNQFKARNVENKLPNWQKITKNKEILEKIKSAKIPLSRIPRKVYSHNPLFLHTQKLRLLMQKSQIFLKKES